MAAYKDIIGQKITKVTSNPGEPKTGQMWYNSTDGKLRGLGLVEAWVSSGSLTSARGFVSHTGTQTASLLAGGISPTPTYFSASEEYNGSGWSTGGSLPAATYALSSAGTQTAALVFGGANSSDTKQSTTYTYDGTSFSATPNSLNTARDQLSGGGVQTSALAVGGRVTSAVVTNMEEWNGSSWTNLTALPEKRGYTHANGPETAFFMAAGALGDNAGSPYTNATLNYDGSSISTGENVNTARSAGGAAGDSANAIFYGGDISGTSQTKTEKYDGTSWSEVADMAVAKRGSGAGAGTSNAAALSAGAYGPPASASTEEFTSSTNTITAAAFSSGTNLPTEKGQGGGAGTQTAAMVTGGLDAPASANLTTTFHYDGSSWTSSGALPSGRRNNSAFGIQTAAVTLGNLNPVDATIDVYNGSSWTGGTSYPSPNSNTGVAGTTTAGLVWGGDQDPGFLSTTNEYNGSWTAGGALPAARSNTACAGTQTAAVTVGGNVGPSSPTATVVNTTLEYDGTNWSSSNNDLVARYNAGGAGIQTSALIFGGNTPSNTAQATLYDGTSFATQPSLGTARFFQTQGLGATSTVALGAGGQTTTRVATVEEFTGETITGNITDFTTS